MGKKITLLTILVATLIGITVFFVIQGYEQDQTLAMNAPVSTPSNNTEKRDNILAAITATNNGPNYFPIRDFNINNPEIKSRAAVIYDRGSGRPLYQQNQDQHLPVASITKLMTAIIAFEQLDMDRIITVSVENINVDGQGADLYQNEKIFASDLLKMLLIKSSNDAALSLAERAKERGIDLIFEMNKKALELGMINTHFNDPAGLSDEAFSTASDLVKLVNYTRRYPELWEIMRNESLDIPSTDGKITHHLVNTNKLLGVIPDIIGGKTGFTDGASGTMILVVEHEGSELVSVVLGTDDRFGETKKLIEWAKIAHKWK